jgi:hypothetical protein
MTFRASFLELALVYGLSAYVFGGVCVFGCTWHNLPASAVSLCGTVYCAARGMECLAAWLSAKWQSMFEDEPAQPAELAHSK